MNARRVTDLRCPECGARLQIDPACVISEPYYPRHGWMRGMAADELPRRERVAPAALCNSCEFCVEIETKAEAPRARAASERQGP